MIRQVDILLQTAHSEEKELIRGVELSKDKTGNVYLAPIVKHLLDIGYPIKNNIISYYSAYD